MASTNFFDYSQNTPIVAAWLNDINKGVYNAGDLTPNLAAQTPYGWVRFNGSTGIVVQQSANISSITRSSAGVYVIAYATVLPQATNSYNVLTNLAGFQVITSESTGSVTITCSNTSNVATDPTIVCVQVWANH